MAALLQRTGFTLRTSLRHLPNSHLFPTTTTTTPSCLRHLSSSPQVFLRNDYARQHHETRLVPFSPAQLYSVVSNVDDYCKFVPWCTSSKVVKRVDDSHIIADLSVGFRFLSDQYTSVITLDRNRKVSADVPNSSLFDYLVTDWTFEPHPNDPNKTNLSFYVEFAFRNRLYRRVTDLFFEEVVRQMVGAFEAQCSQKYSAHHPYPQPYQTQLPSEQLQSASQRAGIFHRW